MKRQEMVGQAARAGVLLLGVTAGLGVGALVVVKRLFMRQRIFSIGIYEGASPLAMRPIRWRRYPMVQAHQITDTPADFVADPFMVWDKDTWYMFFEIWSYATQRGCIGLATSDAKRRRWHYQGVVLSEPFHLSYPLVFFWEGDWYMVPETSEAGDVRLYRAHTFPTGWGKVATLLQKPDMVDSTLFFAHQCWWMFTTEGASTHHRLRLYRADTLLGPWSEHPCSPLIHNDPGRARSAGRVIAYANRLFRLAQDCATVYGAKVRVMEIEALSPTHYQERELEQSSLLRGQGWGWNAGGMHHMDAYPMADGRWVAAVDGWTYVLRRRK